MPLDAYKSLRLAQRDTQRHALQELMAAQNIADTIFYTWASAKIDYAAGNDLCKFPFWGRINHSIDEEAPYFDFFQTIPCNNAAARYFGSYATFLDAVFSSHQIMANLSEKHAERRALLRRDSLSLFPLMFDLMVKRTTGPVRTALLGKLFLTSGHTAPPAYRDSVAAHLPAEQLAQLRQKTTPAHQNMPILTLLEQYDMPAPDKAVLRDLYHSTQGKVVVHDFWFHGCAPCMEELPHYNALIEAAGAGVEFVFLAAHTTPANWQATREHFQLKGRHILLTKNQLAFYEKYFEVEGFPHHTLSTRAGNVAKISLPRISAKNQAEVLKVLQMIE